MKLARMTGRMPGPGGGASGTRAMATPAAEDRGESIPWSAIPEPPRARLPLRGDGNGAMLPFLLPGAPMDDLGTSLLRGTLDLLILKAASWEPRHGYAVAEWISAATGEQLRLG